MLIKTLDGDGIIAHVEGTFEDAYNFAMLLWEHAGIAGIHMEGLEIWDERNADHLGIMPEKMLTINYVTHER